MTTSTDRHDVLLHVAVEREPLGLALRLHGELDIATAASLVDAALEHISGAEAAGAAQRHVVVDLSQLAFLDVSGLRALLEVRSIVLDAGGEMSISGASRHVARLFEVAGLADVLEVRPSPKSGSNGTE